MENREIKFRAWNGCKMYDDVTVCSGYDWDMLGDCRTGNILMQFTGITDRNGKEIYEDDIISYQNGFKRVENEWVDNVQIRLVKFENASFNIANLHLVTKSIEVIRNIHQNPSLLKTE